MELLTCAPHHRVPHRAPLRGRHELVLLLLDPSRFRVYSPPTRLLPSNFNTRRQFMSFRRALWALAVTVCLAAPVAVHAQGDYLDVFMVKVKPEKTADFLALARKYADANRRFNGDRWLASQALYGEAVSTSSPASARTTPIPTRPLKLSCSPPTKPSARKPPRK